MLFLLKSKTGAFCTGFWFSSKRHKTCFSQINLPNCVMTYYFPRLFLVILLSTECHRKISTPVRHDRFDHVTISTDHIFT